jgi:hypothetical protein
MEGEVTVLGGLPCYAVVHFWKGDGYTTDDDYEVTLFWLKRDGKKGAPFSVKMYNRLATRDPYWSGDTVEQLADAERHEEWLERCAPPILLS